MPGLWSILDVLIPQFVSQLYESLNLAILALDEFVKQEPYEEDCCQQQERCNRYLEAVLVKYLEEYTTSFFDEAGVGKCGSPNSSDSGSGSIFYNLGRHSSRFA